MCQSIFQPPLNPEMLVNDNLWEWGMILEKAFKTGLAASVSALALSFIAAAPARAQSVQLDIVHGIVQNILQSVRDQIQGRRLVAPPGMMRFSSEGSEFDNRNPFASQDPGNPFQALAYAKAPAMAAPPPPAWIYGINGVLSGDRTNTIFSTTSTFTATGAFDVTKIGIFTASDALTFVATGSNSWSHNLTTPIFDSTTPSASGTLAYTNGGFSTDFTATGSWTRNTLIALGIAAPADSSSMSYSGNVQYKFDLPYSFFFEPTVGVTYTDIYTANFGMRIGDNTMVDAGGRIGTEMKWMGFTVQPQLSGAVFKTVVQDGATAPGAGGVPAIGGVSDTGLGGRGSAKINVIWTQNFSSYVEAHGSGIAGTKTQGYTATQTYGAQGGVRYTW
jgi:hypothetical protein